MNYWETRNALAKVLFPRTQYLHNADFLRLGGESDIREKGRKKGYAQYNVLSNRFERKELNFKNEILKNFIETSTHIINCPLPINIDLYDNIKCPFGCIYCFANRFRASLYTSFYDNYKEVGIRSCSPDYFLPKMEKLLTASERSIGGASPLTKGLAMKIPIRIGARFENMLYAERDRKVTLRMLQFLTENKYPVIVNTKSPLIAEDNYVKVLSSFKKGTGVQITMISSDQELLSKLEPFAPSLKERMKACKILTDEGIHVVARLQPLMFFINDEKSKVDDYIAMLKESGIKNVAMENMSYRIATPKMQEQFIKMGYDFTKMEQFTTFSQRISSFLMSKFSAYLRKHGLNISSNDFGQATENSHEYVCCGFDNVAPWDNINYGNIFTAMRFIQRRGKVTAWSDFDSFVNKKGGFLSDSVRADVQNIWNISLYKDKNANLALDFGAHFIPMGEDEDGLLWKYDKSFDLRAEVIEKFIERQ